MKTAIVKARTATMTGVIEIGDKVDVIEIDEICTVRHNGNKIFIDRSKLDIVETGVEFDDAPRTVYK